MLKINLQFFADNTEAPDWIKKLEQADREGKTPQSSANNTIASAANTSSNSKTSSSLSNNNGTSNRDTLINQYANAMKKQRLADLQNAYNNTLNKIAEQERQVGQTAQANRNQASVQSQLAQRNLANYMVNAGLTNSGTNAQMMINNSGALQNTLGGITQNEQNTLNQLANQRALAYQNLQNDTASANAGIDAQLLNNQINYLDQLNQLKMQQDYNTRMAQQQRDWAVEDRNYNTDVNNIWDDKLGRYVSQSMYLQTHPEIVPQYYTSKSSSNGSSSSKTANTSVRSLSNLTDSQYTAMRKDYESRDLKDDGLTFEQWAYKNRGYGDSSVYLTNLDRYNEYGKAIVNYLNNGEMNYLEFINSLPEMSRLVDRTTYNEILNYAREIFGITERRNNI